MLPNHTESSHIPHRPPCRRMLERAGNRAAFRCENRARSLQMALLEGIPGSAFVGVKVEMAGGGPPPEATRRRTSDPGHRLARVARGGGRLASGSAGSEGGRERPPVDQG
jgi:hypothetical protein